MQEDHISLRDAYIAMYQFLGDLYRRTGSDAVGGLLGSMSTLPDGQIVDGAIWKDWLGCVAKARAGQVDTGLGIGRTADRDR